MDLPYATATSKRARDDTQALLSRFGCSKFGWMNDVEEGVVELYFEWRGRQVRMRASARGWAALYLNAHPWTPRHRRTKAEYEARTQRHAMEVVVYCLIRDWLKGCLTAVESQAFPFDHVFLPWMVTADGRTIAERAEVRGLLPAPDGGAET